MKRATNTNTCDFKRRHNLLQDLLSSKIVLERCTLVNRRPFGPDYAAIRSPLQDIQSRGDLLGSNPSQSCSICSSDNQIDWISEEEMDILLKVVFNSSPINFDLVLTSRCKICASTIATLTKLRKKIDDTVFCLRTVFKLRNDPQFAEISTVNVAESQNTFENGDETHYIVMPDVDEERKSKIEDMELEITDLEDGDDDLVEVSRSHEGQNVDEEIPMEDDSTNATTKAEKISGNLIKSVDDDKHVTEFNTNQPNNDDLCTNAPPTKPTCTICGVSFSSEYSIKRHMSSKWVHKMTTNKHHKKHPYSNQVDQAAFGEEIKPIIIRMELEISDIENNDEVDSVLDDDSNMALHQSAMSKIAIASKIECQLCRSSFSSSSQLKKHLRIKGTQRCEGKQEWKKKINSTNNNNNKDAESHQDSSDVYIDSATLNSNEKVNNNNEDVAGSTVSDRATANKRKSRIRAEELLKSIANDTNDNKIVSRKRKVESPESDNHYSSESSDDEENNTGIAVKKSKRRNSEKKEEILTQQHANACEQCGECFIWKSRLVHHLIKHGWHKGQYKPNPKRKCLKGRKNCEICQLDFVCGYAHEAHLLSSMHRLGLKQRQVSEQGVVTFDCLYCEKSFDKLEELSHHGKYMECEKYICGPCDKRFTTSTAYNAHAQGNRHMEKVLEQDGIDLQKDCKFHCDICGKAFLRNCKLLQHKTYHHDKQFVCEICGKAFGTSGGLKSHHDLHTSEGRTRQQPRKADYLIEPRNKPYGCLKCPKRFQMRKALCLHTKVVHQGFRFKCNNCLTEFKTAHALKQHMVKFHKPTDAHETVVVKEIAPKARVRYPCDICSYSASQKLRTLIHIELKHFPNKSSCPYGCKNEIANEDEWLHHLKECESPKLTANSRCRCWVCGDVFTSQLLRMDHHLKQHNSYSCEFCDIKLVQKLSLRPHLLQHEESKPFLCTKCGKRFRQKYNLDLHSTTICGDDETARKELLAKRREQHRLFRDKDKPYKCDQCSKAFILEDKLKAHIERVHGNAQSEEHEDDI